MCMPRSFSLSLSLSLLPVGISCFCFRLYLPFVAIIIFSCKSQTGTKNNKQNEESLQELKFMYKEAKAMNVWDSSGRNIS